MNNEWIKDVPEIVRDNLYNLDGIPVDILMTSASVYLSLREDQNQRARSAAVLKLLDEILDEVLALKGRLTTLPIGVDELIATAAIRHGGMTIPKLVGGLDDLKYIIMTAEQMAPAPERGRPGTPREYLMEDVARALSDAGLPADAKPTGPLVQCIEIILSGLGEQVARPPVVVANALKKEKARLKTIAALRGL